MLKLVLQSGQIKMEFDYVQYGQYAVHEIVCERSKFAKDIGYGVVHVASGYTAIPDGRYSFADKEDAVHYAKALDFNTDEDDVEIVDGVPHPSRELTNYAVNLWHKLISGD